MVDFTASIAAGIDAHQEHLRNRAEVSEILTALNDQLMSSTQEKVGARLDTVEVNIEDMLSMGIGSEGTSLAVFSVAFPEISRKLSLIKVPTSGYPVFLKWSKERLTCADRDSLISTLSKLLELPFVGRAITELADYNPGAEL